MKVILVTTKGFNNLKSDSIIQQNNAFIFNLLDKTAFFETVIEVDEAIDMNGMVIKELNEQSINNALRQILKYNLGQTIYIAFLNSRFNPLHETILENILHTAGYTSIQVSNKMKDPGNFISV